jgi:aspartyl-tRNA(Asn)/glutamyl-tRNA(Gln) amidotransferase subunit A
MTQDLAFATVTELVGLIHDRRLSPVELCDFFLDRIRTHDGEIGAFCTVDEDQVRESARDAERAQMRGEMGPLHGIPVGVKDLIFTRGLRTTGGSSIYADFVPDEDDVVVERLRESGAVVLGKTNTAEFGFSANQTANALFGATRNPWDQERSPGGSSGGSAAAVAAGLAPVALGSDGGGSIRIPSSFCGLYGIKPTFGRVPLYPGCRDHRFPGLSGWESLEHIGPIARTVADAALLMDVLSGPDTRDRHSLPHEEPSSYSRRLAAASTDLTGLRIAWSSDWGGEEPVDGEVRHALEQAVAQMQALGAEVVQDQPARPASRDAFGALIALDADPHALRRLIEDHEASVSPRLKTMMQREWSFIELTTAMRLRKQMYAAVEGFFRRYDAFLTPTVPFTALALGAEGPESIDGVPPKDPARAVIGYCYPFNITGHPAASVPCGLDRSGLPIGMQIVADRLHDDLVLRLSRAFEEASPWRGLRPTVLAAR